MSQATTHTSPGFGESNAKINEVVVMPHLSVENVAQTSCLQAGCPRYSTRY
jgi:hypothetical protein